MCDNKEKCGSETECIVEDEPGRSPKHGKEMWQKELDCAKYSSQQAQHQQVKIEAVTKDLRNMNSSERLQKIILKPLNLYKAITATESMLSGNSYLIPYQATYYARQLYLYNFPCAKDLLNRHKPKAAISVWTENEFSKGSNQIASAVRHRLIDTNTDTANTVRLFSDGCGGQDKNKTVIAIILHWFLLEAPLHIEQIYIWFPIVGYSFMPPDRIFEHLEREFHSRSVIETPDEYVKFIKNRGTVTHLETLELDIFSSSQKAKKIVVTKSKTNASALVRGEPFYNFESGVPKSLCKRGKTFRHTQIPSVPKGVPVKPAKLRDVNRLLVLHFGEEGDNNLKLEFFKSVFEEESFPTEGLNEDEENEEPLDFDSTSGCGRTDCHEVVRTVVQSLWGFARENSREEPDLVTEVAIEQATQCPNHTIPEKSSVLKNDRERRGTHCTLCRDVNYTTAFKWLKRKSSNDWAQRRAKHSLRCNSSSHAADRPTDGLRDQERGKDSPLHSRDETSLGGRGWSRAFLQVVAPNPPPPPHTIQARAGESGSSFFLAAGEITSSRSGSCLVRLRDVEDAMVTAETTSVDLCFTAFGVGPLVFVRGSMNTEAYCNILDNEMLTTLWHFYVMDPCYFQDNNAWCHVSRAIMQWYADNNVRRLDWPAQSPDLNPIEHIWDELDRRVRAHQARPKSIAQLMEWLQEEWRRISLDILQTLVESMPDRVAAVVAARDHTERILILELSVLSLQADFPKFGIETNAHNTTGIIVTPANCMVTGRKMERQRNTNVGEMLNPKKRIFDPSQRQKWLKGKSNQGVKSVHFTVNSLHRFDLQGITAKAGSGVLELGFFLRKRHIAGNLTCTSLAETDPHDVIRCKTVPVHEGVAKQRSLASNLDEPGSIPGGITSGFSQVGIVPDDAAGRWVSSGIFRFPRALHSDTLPCSPRFALYIWHSARRSDAFRRGKSAPQRGGPLQIGADDIEFMTACHITKFFAVSVRAIQGAFFDRPCKGCSVQSRRRKDKCAETRKAPDRGGAVIGLLAFRLSEPGSISRRVALRFSQEEIALDYAIAPGNLIASRRLSQWWNFPQPAAANSRAYSRVRSENGYTHVKETCTTFRLCVLHCSVVQAYCTPAYENMDAHFSPGSVPVTGSCCVRRVCTALSKHQFTLQHFTTCHWDSSEFEKKKKIRNQQKFCSCSVGQMNRRKKSLSLRAYILMGALSDIRSVKLVTMNGRVQEWKKRDNSEETRRPAASSGHDSHMRKSGSDPHLESNPVRLSGKQLVRPLQNYSPRTKAVGDLRGGKRRAPAAHFAVDLDVVRASRGQRAGRRRGQRSSTPPSSAAASRGRSCRRTFSLSPTTVSFKVAGDAKSGWRLLAGSRTSGMATMDRFALTFIRNYFPSIVTNLTGCMTLRAPVNICAGFTVFSSSDERHTAMAKRTFPLVNGCSREALAFPRHSFPSLLYFRLYSASPAVKNRGSILSCSAPLAFLTHLLRRPQATSRMYADSADRASFVFVRKTVARAIYDVALSCWWVSELSARFAYGDDETKL
ncbi:hypothetical protein PR048_000426 [Dryococelus australis]|uniref:Tc1-like transposase DDE domain-containing protein n=1 Tax=Dryococelus australis TaxID=614101 RepID=A0ABQ9IFG6_9NEOP|nr:hypothetical protein PR048_000426 [Dryococelus australis]